MRDNIHNLSDRRNGGRGLSRLIAALKLQDLRISLVWTDPPAEVYGTDILLHDLDLTVTAQSTGTVYYPNGYSGADTLNNVEKVVITDTSPLETYTIQVRFSSCYTPGGLCSIGTRWISGTSLE